MNVKKIVDFVLKSVHLLTETTMRILLERDYMGIFPGFAIDQKQGIILIALRGVRNKGDKDEHHMEWGIKDGFLRKQELWETSVNHPTGCLKINIIFPPKRPPVRASLIEDTRQKTTLLGNENLIKLPDGHWRVHWETNQVKQHERYSIQWEW